MITLPLKVSETKLYLADQGKHCIFVFASLISDNFKYRLCELFNGEEASPFIGMCCSGTTVYYKGREVGYFSVNLFGSLAECIYEVKTTLNVDWLNFK